MKKLTFLFIGMLTFIFAQGLFFYKGWYFSPKFKTPEFEKITPILYQPTEFGDTISEKKTGKIIVDLSHNNNFSLSELNVLFGRVFSRGFTIELVRTASEFKTSLPEANALIVVCPRKEFSKEDVKIVDDFLKGGKKVLLIGDPTRPSEINSLSFSLNLLFEPGYLYNLKENDTNYRNIFVVKFKENPLTKGLKKIVLYTTGFISPSDLGIAFTDENTFSSLFQARKEMSPIVLAKEGKVLAIYDLTFMSEPWSNAADNNQFISNIADWLTTN